MPNKAPTLEIDPSHEICSLFNGPSMSGVSSDRSFGSAGENQPTIHPIPSVIKLAVDSIFFRIENHEKSSKIHF